MPGSLGSSRGGLDLAAKVVFAAFLAIGAFLLVAEHRAHVVSYLPWLLVAACPILHLFMHGGHRHGHGSGDETPEGSGAGHRHPPGGEEP